MINRHGDFDPAEIRRMLKPGGYFVTQQLQSAIEKDGSFTGTTHRFLIVARKPV